MRQLFKHVLVKNGYFVKEVSDGTEALHTLETDYYDLMISDIMMPNMDGFDLAENVRMIDKQVPIVFMTAKDDKQSKMLGYSLEIDDYITKPFDIDLLVLKIKAILRRSKIKSDKELVVGNFVMNQEERVVAIDGEEVSFTMREFDLLFKLLSYPKKTFTRSALMEEFWDFDSSATSRTVDVYMAKLREKTAKATGFEIVTVHGLGYKAVIKNEKQN